MPQSKIYAIALCEEKCNGCTNCIRVCPTEAIRVKKQKAKITKKRCINCGQCISVCPHNALTGISDKLEAIEAYSYKIALVDPVLYAQFNEDTLNPEDILNRIRRLGFDMVYEVTRSAPIITDFTKKFMEESRNLPVISSSCPAILRTIQIRFPDLIDHILPMDSPAE
ncbi:4Fe-4S binding protein, partial [Pectobacterium versatile]|uniref:4Fe-4S binding protein n=1 Tax=Pectobacterium versatile TaxID=2488639 RepID=UPI000F8D41B0